MVLVFAVGQYVVLTSIKQEYKDKDGKIGGLKKHGLDWIDKTVTITQYALIAILVFTILQMLFMSSYHVIVLRATIFISYGLSFILLALLAKRFFSWFKLNHNLVVLAYALATTMISINAAITIIYTNTQISENTQQDYVRPIRSLTGSFSSTDAIYDSAYVITSVLSFILTWIATVLLLRHYSKKLGMIKYWIIVSIPLAYFLSQFQSLFLYSFADLRLSNPVLFGIIYNLIFSVSKPAGGILFGIAFWSISKNLTSKTVKSYLMISAYGMMLLFTVNQPTGLTLIPYPPFGLVTISFMGLSSYMILVGIYSSAISVAQDVKLRQAIKRTAIDQSKLLISIGSAQIEKEIEKKVITVTQKEKYELIEQTGVQPSLTQGDMKQYLDSVLKEIKVLQNVDEIVKKGREILQDSIEFMACLKLGGMRLAYNNYFDVYEKTMVRHRNGEHKGIRWVTSIDRDSVEIVKQFLKIGIRIRHVKNILPIDFVVSDKEMIATIEKLEGGEMAKSLLSTNDQPYLEHFISIFEELWKNGIDAKNRIKDIEEGIDTEGIEIIQNPVEVTKLSVDLIKSAKEEVVGMFSTANAFHRQEYSGNIQLLKELAKETGINVRILTPMDSSIEQELRKEQQQLSHKFNIRSVQPHLQTKVSILVIDKMYSLVVELKDDTKQTSEEAIGLAIYSNSKSTVLSYYSIFESLWKQTELYEQLREAHEQLKLHDKIQKEFINIAAHELRTPIQPILGLSELIQSKIKDAELCKLQDVVIRNAKRLQRLTEDILDVTRIESNSLTLKKGQFNLNEIMLDIISDCRNQIQKEHKDNIKLELFSIEDHIFVNADKNRLNQVISNLLNNAIKFTKEGGIITIGVQKKDNNDDYVTVSVKDTGTGIDPEILPRLFTKFATKSETGGTGLGLYISKSIIEAHGGRIWAENNSDGKGATFSFSLPIN
jgi:signal transduction histidine kinase